MPYRNVSQHVLGVTIADQIGSIVVLGVLFALLYRFAVAPVVHWTLDILDHRRLRKRHLVFLELTPPSSNTKTTLATAQLYAGLHGLLSNAAFADGLLHHKHSLSLEIVATRDHGMRYMAAVEHSDVSMFRQLFVSYLPNITIHEVADYLPQSILRAELRTFTQAGHSAIPLASHSKLSQHDPMAYIAGSLSRLQPAELTSLQLVVLPADHHSVRRQLLPSRNIGSRYAWWSYPMNILFSYLRFILTAIARTFELTSGAGRGSAAQAQLSPHMTHALEAAHDKVGQPLFTVNIRALALGPNNEARLLGLTSVLHMFHVPGYQGLIARRGFPGSWFRQYRLRAFGRRLPAVLTHNTNILAASEVAALYHFPYGESHRTENLVTSLSKTLPAPIALRRHADAGSFDVLLGVNRHHGTETPVGLTAAERERHVYIIGGTGNGKTTLLQYGLVQDIRSGKGVAVIDPHGDLAETLLRYVPEDRIQDVIYCNPRDVAYPVSLNLLEQPTDVSEDELLLEQDFITESVVSIFRKVFSEDDSGGHKIEHVLRCAIHTAYTVPNATLFTVYKLLTNAKFRTAVVDALTDEDLIDFWKGEFNMAGSFQRVKMASGVTAKLGRFQRSIVSRRIFEQPKSTIDFDDIIQNHKILICNFSKGYIGEDTATLLGIGVMAKLQLAALKRSRLGQTERTPFYLYVDEFQTFATTSFVQLLSEARKYKLFLTMAEQSTAQQEERRLVDVILANVGTVLSFRSGSPIDEQLLLPIFSPYIQKGEIATLSAYHFYARLSGVKAQALVSGETVMPEDSGSDEIAQRVISASRKQYASYYVSPKKR